MGPSIGAKFRHDAMVAGLLSCIAVIIYLSFRFEFMYGIGAIVAIIHDVIAAGGLFIVFFNGQLSLTAIAALMTIIGYSLNDTIVIFDRVREMQANHKEMTYRQLVNGAVNGSLSRTLITSLTTLFVVISLLILGGGVIFDFAIIMFFGCICGTFSSNFIATSFVDRFHKFIQQDKNTARAAVTANK